ncbi:hypothetical protein [Deefgea rivuli]|uniref:hypothetical protein n=1 Tax=Deefgea rivuli TaxID=400948 RepID=UPI0012EC7066|nr:hypothetical protein [Deefgea rivuli]
MPKQTHNSIPIEILQFFNAYCAAYNQLDSSRIAEHFALPSGIAQQGQYFHFTENAALLNNMQALCEHYRQDGFVNADYQISTFLPQGQYHCVVDIVWTITRAKPQLPTQFQTTYNLIWHKSGWRIQLCTAYQEQFNQTLRVHHALHP